MRILILVGIAVILAFIIRQAWASFMLARVGAIPRDVDVPEVKLEPDRGWQVTRSVSKGVATIAVVHPVEGTKEQWTIYLREPGAAHQLEETMQSAGQLVRLLSADS